MLLARKFVLSIVTLATLTGAAPALAGAAATKPFLQCTLVVDAASGATLARQGVCDRQVSPASTFKVPLALMGFDAGILVDEHTPRWDYKPEFKAVKRDHKPVDPTIWEKDSVVWFSQQITRKLGQERFAAYITSLGYGNRDISGNRGKKDGLAHSWLSSSLKISPEQQVALMRGIADRSLPLSAKAFEMTEAVLPDFQAGTWRVTGKTGTGWLPGKDGTPDRSRPLGWFVGWAEKGGRKIVFANLFVNEGKSPVLLGPQVRANFLAGLPAMTFKSN
ncbi:class D beta-lactamase [Aminobacter sp. HY435]|uniref:class D beta-lactamase n=1 Tax=Aminobacter sp. HY435 TaxID=2970917 RepID=UPI0022B98602|nr:class D beta-lactamase [Aminobacter sp. HY435]